MINVFKKRTRLYALTTSAFFFLQGVDSSVGNNWFSFSSPGLSSFATFIPKSLSDAVAEQAVALSLTSVSNSISKGIASLSESVVTMPGTIATGVASALEFLEVAIEPSLEAKPALPRRYVSLKQLHGSRIPLFALFPKNHTDMCENSSDDSERGSIVCVDGKEHTIKGGKIRVKKYSDNAVFAAGRLVIDKTDRSHSSTVTGKAGSRGVRTAGGANSLRSDIVEGPVSKTVAIAKATSVKIENVSIIGVDPQDFSARTAIMGVGSAVFSLAGAKVDLLKSKIEDFVTGLEAGYKGNIHMKGGSIKKTFLGATASFESSIFLEGTDINVEVVNEKVPLYAVGLHSSGGSQITMKSGSITFEKGGVGIWAEDEGFVKLEDVRINIVEKERDREESPEGTLDEEAASSVLDPSVVFLLDGGFVSSNRVTFNGSNTIALWIDSNYSIEDGLFNVITSSSDSRGADEFTEFVDNIFADDYVNISAAINYSVITVENRGSYGIYFGESEPGFEKTSLEVNDQSEEGEDSSARVRRSGDVAGQTVATVASGGDVESQASSSFPEEDGTHMVLLRRSVLKVPDSVAIYGNDLSGYVVLGKDTLVSGDLLLRATGSSSLSVFAHESSIVGSARIDKTASANLFLSDSEWHLTKSKYSNEASDTDCIDSCVSSVDLSNSVIAFLRSEGEDRGYQTLRVGNGNGAVYAASGNSYIYFNARLVPSDSDNDQMSDRLLIHGNVSGKTIVHVKDTSEGTQQDENKPHSISIIQVFGRAENDSFKLEGGYITPKGLPYKYVLRAYGPTTPQKMQYFDKTLLVRSTDVWDFRLENEYVISLAAAHTATTDTGAGEVNSESITPPVSGESASVIPARGDSLLRSESSDEFYEDDYDEEEDFEESETPEAIVRTSSSVTPPSSRVSGSLVPSRVNSRGRSDTGRGSVISADGISVTSGYRIVSKSPAPIRSAASMSPSALAVSEKFAAPSSDALASHSSRAVGRVLMLSHSGNGNVSSKETASSICGDMNNGENGVPATYLCSDGQTRTVANITLKASEATQRSMHATNQNTIIKLEGATISGADSSGSRNNVDSTTLQAVSAVLAENNAKVVLDKNSTIRSSVIGLEAQKGGTVEMIGGTVDALYVGALAGSGSSVNLKDMKINVTGDLAVAGLASQAGKVSMDSGAITLEKGVAVRSEAGGSVELDKVNITAKKGQGKLDSVDNFGRAAFLVRDNASVDFKNGNVVTDAHAVWVMKSGDAVETGSSRRRRSSDVRPTMNHVNIESSTVKVEGDGVYGIYFDGETQKEARQQNRSKDLATEQTSVVKRSAVSRQENATIGVTGAISLKKTDFEVANGIAIYGNNSGGRVSLENKTTLAGDLLLKAENDSNISVSVDNSIVTGGVRVDKNSYAKLDLANSSQWILKRRAQRNLETLDSGCVDSCISSVSLVNSAIDFAPSESEGKYQTLHIGNGKGTVYAAQGNAVIHLNARLNPRDPSDQQVTDRLVIHGDVSGKTKIHVRGDAGNVGDGKANAKIAHTVSMIQVYGQAKKDSFQLDGNYVALRNSPYKYTLRAYAPEATSKQEHVQQKFVKEGGEFWNFRLENQYVKSVRSAALPEQFVRSVVPQVPTYLSLPNSVFHAGLMDISNQNKQLETLRMTSTGMVEVRENPALYLRGYGGSYRYASDLSALEYGYGGDLSYNGVEAGVLLQTIENADSAISFGVMGTYGKLSLQPVNVEHSQKSAFDKWTATVYGSMQHNVGFYVDGLLSYGLFKGDVLTLARGKTATLKGNPLSVSLAGGQTIATGYKGFVFDPQVQVVYQHLQFNKARDIDNFDIEMGNLNQWVARVGGRLTKIPTGSEGVNAIAFYGKLYLAHGFEGKQSVHFNDAFKLGAFGSSLEAGLGFNAKLLPQFSLHADILYQHKLNKAGFSGTSFSGGVRYQF
ncbi:autotransporter outer membrane beta-barrel domain-containing protein [Bartonella sp. AD24XZML]|uniref:autotransporter outer membrane beta-barrel domain-containing protein n=1 Tax=Bartonella sp. AD24XZML TaxID=3243463 RepID=UPI0035CEE8DE